MPTELHVIRASEFIRVGPDSSLDLAASQKMLREAAALCRKRGIDHVLLDVRQVHTGPKPRVSPNDVADLVRTFSDMGLSPSQRMAVLYTNDPHARARLFAFIASVQGWKVRAFESYEEAIGWLASTREPETASVIPPNNGHLGGTTK